MEKVTYHSDNGQYNFGSLTELKRKMAAVLDLSHQGTLVYENDAGAYQLRGRFTEIPAGFDRMGSDKKAALGVEGGK